MAAAEESSVAARILKFLSLLPPAARSSPPAVFLSGSSIICERDVMFPRPIALQKMAVPRGRPATGTGQSAEPS